MTCPMCGSEEQRYTAVLGSLLHAQCRHCGVMFVREVTELASDTLGPNDNDEMLTELEELRDL